MAQPADEFHENVEEEEEDVEEGEEEAEDADDASSEATRVVDHRTNVPVVAALFGARGSGTSGGRGTGTTGRGTGTGGGGRGGSGGGRGSGAGGKPAARRDTAEYVGGVRILPLSEQVAHAAHLRVGQVISVRCVVRATHRIAIADFEVTSITGSGDSRVVIAHGVNESAPGVRPSITVPYPGGAYAVAGITMPDADHGFAAAVASQRGASVSRTATWHHAKSPSERERLVVAFADAARLPATEEYGGQRTLRHPQSVPDANRTNSHYREGGSWVQALGLELADELAPESLTNAAQYKRIHHIIEMCLRHSAAALVGHPGAAFVERHVREHALNATIDVVFDADKLKAAYAKYKKETH